MRILRNKKNRIPHLFVRIRMANGQCGGFLLQKFRIQWTRPHSEECSSSIKKFGITMKENFAFDIKWCLFYRKQKRHKKRYLTKSACT